MNYIVHGVMKNQTQLSNSHFTSRPLWLGVHADDTTLMAESEEELKSLLMKVKRRVKKLA